MNQFFSLGQHIATAAHKQDAAQLNIKSAFIETLEHSPTFCAELCGSLGAMLEMAGKENSFERHLLDTLQKEACEGNSTAQFLQSEIVDSFLEVLGEGSTDMTKEALQGGGALAGVLARLGLSATPGMTKLLLGTGAAIGTSAGALNWMLNRHSKQDEEDIMATQARIDEYNRITDELQRKLKDKGISPDQDETKKKIKGVSGAEQVNIYG
jgi:hypothetical protein